MNTEIILLPIIITGGLLGVLVFFLIKNLTAPRKISALQEQLKDGKTFAVIRSAKKILAKNPRNTDAHYYLALAYEQDGTGELALLEYQAIDRISNFTEICTEAILRRKIAPLYLQYGQEEEALKEYLLLTELDPYDDRNFYQAGKLLEKRNKGSQALQFYKKALEVNPLYSDAWFAIGHLFYRGMKKNEAKTAFEKALKIKPNDYRASFYLGQIQKDFRNFTEALDAFEKAQRDPDFKIRALFERGTCFLATKNYEKAESELKRVIKLSKDGEHVNEVMHARYFLSVCYEQTRNFEGAIEQWEYLHSKKKDFRDVAEKLSQYQKFREDDRIRDFITESPEKFEKTCQRIATAMNLSIMEYTSLPEGAQIIAMERSTTPWRNTRQFPECLRILRVTSVIDLSSIRDFHEMMRKAGINRGHFITSSHFTRSAYEFTETRPVNLIPQEKLQELLKEAETLDKAEH